MIGQIAASHADGMNLTHLLGHRHEIRHRAERLAEEIRVQTGDDHPDATVGKLLGHIHKRHVIELGLINPHDLHIRADFQHLLRILDRMARYLVEVVRDNVIL